MVFKLVSVFALSFVALTVGQQCSGPMDIVYVLDRSGSIDLSEFNKAIASIQNAVKGYNVGSSDAESHVGMTSFNDTAYTEFLLNTYTTETTLLAGINAVSKFTGGGTAIAKGMLKAATEVFGNAGDRQSVPNVMVVITDGVDNLSGDAGIELARETAVAKGVTIWAVGVGKDVSVAQLEKVAGDASRVRYVSNFDLLKETLESTPCSSTAPPTCQPKCMDLYSECAGWAKLSYCSSIAPSIVPSLPWATFMKDNCRASCGVLPTSNFTCTPVCEDFDDTVQCAELAAAGQCKANPTYMLVRCKKTCGYCNKCENLHVGCPALEQAGKCNNGIVADMTHTHFYCRASCGDCVQEPPTCTKLDSTGKCPQNWKFSPSLNKCVYQTVHAKSFADSKAECLAMAGGSAPNVISINNQTTNDFLLNSYTQPTGAYAGAYWYWIGLERISDWSVPSGAAWTDGAPYGYSYFWNLDRNYPAGENNAAYYYSNDVNNGKWGDWIAGLYQGTYAKLPAFCEMNPCPPPTPAPTGCTCPTQAP